MSGTLRNGHTNIDKIPVLIIKILGELMNESNAIDINYLRIKLMYISIIINHVALRFPTHWPMAFSPSQRYASAV